MSSGWLIFFVSSKGSPHEHQRNILLMTYTLLEVAAVGHGVAAESAAIVVVVTAVIVVVVVAVATVVIVVAVVSTIVVVVTEVASIVVVVAVVSAVVIVVAVVATISAVVVVVAELVAATAVGLGVVGGKGATADGADVDGLRAGVGIVSIELNLGAGVEAAVTLVAHVQGAEVDKVLLLGVGVLDEAEALGVDPLGDDADVEEGEA